MFVNTTEIIIITLLGTICLVGPEVPPALAPSLFRPITDHWPSSGFDGCSCSRRCCLSQWAQLLSTVSVVAHSIPHQLASFFLQCSVVYMVDYSEYNSIFCLSTCAAVRWPAVASKLGSYAITPPIKNAPGHILCYLPGTSYCPLILCIIDT